MTKVKFEISLIDDNSSYAFKQKLASLILNDIWNSEEFKRQVLGNTITECTGWWRWKKCKQVTKFSSTSETNEQVYNKLMSRETAVIKQDIVYCRNPNVIGYEDGTDVTKICEGWDDYLDVAGVVGNIAHEYCHSLGYHHSSASDHNSVPYRVGTIAETLARKLRPDV